MDWLSLLPPLLYGAEVTAWITLASTAGGAILAFAAGIGSTARFAGWRWLAGLYVQIFRGTSLLVQLFWLYFALPIIGIRLSPEVAGVLALSLNIGAYGAEVVRGSLNSVDAGQYEAATALNFTPIQTLWRILMPQALIEMMPPFGNLAIQNLKDSALVSLISLADLAFAADNLRNRTLETLPILILTLLLYFAMALVLMAAMRLLERYLRGVSGREATR
ncbi:ectoine/hydroxyectoine ABC transporter permease subunit EhuC [Salinisphaera sp.]|uniref:ectoine/hydroxyectoine ABC transporter permease subunit EhuC n=1 Tax=Salinisphaera sp. TaxID=1914330 RepID=UPI002D789918|nr:ectoine/hydroxyectoine ABC transporter permease subunit EhuC [Salinisphaera sp.]HET7312983.1 ectoine/hydroxyectoine ABC transporter permease subunit EhuC [Salinisphaera sp.]